MRNLKFASEKGEKYLETIFASTISEKLSLGATVNIIMASLIMGLFISGNVKEMEMSKKWIPVEFATIN